VIGQPTMKKCLVHNGAPLAGGGPLPFTTGRVATLDGSSLCARGVVPDQLARGPRAFADALVRLTRDPNRLRLGLGREVVLGEGDAVVLDEAGGASARVRVAGEAVVLEDHKPAWVSDHRVTLVAHPPGSPPRVEVVVERPGVVLPASRRVLRLARGKTVEIGDGLAVRFVGHGQTQTGATSPLIVAVQLSFENGGSPGEATYNIDIRKSAELSFRDRSFRLKRLEQDVVLVLEVSRRALTFP
jgi:hypothetical protein